MQYIKIPEERVAVLIGTGGSVKRDIESKTKTKLTIDEGNVTIEGEGVGAMTARDVALAIGRGFSPEVAFGLFREDNVLEIISLSDVLGSEKEMMRKKGRIIGTRGKTRSFIEGVTRTSISVYGKSVGIIGRYDDVQTAKEAAIMLLQGGRHSVVYRFLEKTRMAEGDYPTEDAPVEDED
jgi:ribosomal RNA assembly protein